jgi:GlpG protein
MRQIGTLIDPAQAQLLADHLYTLRIETRLDRQPDGVAVWVCDEDRVPQARQEMAAFLSDPADQRYVAAARTARQMRRQEDAVEENYRVKQAGARQAQEAAMQEAAPAEAPRGRPVTFALVAASILVGLATQLGDPDRDNPQAQRLLTTLEIASRGQLGLSEVAAGQVWRLLTPIFIHFGIVHLLFNLLMLNDLGGLVEENRGSGRFILLVLLLAVTSNLAQLFLGHPRWVAGHGLVFLWHSNFGGLSGVLYGLFGYAWMKARFEPQLGLTLAPGTVALLMGWFVLCLTPAIPGVANAAHAAGLLVGILVGVAPSAWKALRRR